MSMTIIEPIEISVRNLFYDTELDTITACCVEEILFVRIVYENKLYQKYLTSFFLQVTRKHHNGHCLVCH
jgi:hypothetical protein